MAHTYMIFDFGADELRAQQARHKLEGWKQAFRLDKKLQIKFERTELPDHAAQPEVEETEKTTKGAKAGKPRGTAKTPHQESANPDGSRSADVKLLVRLYFSKNEKLSEQQWMTRIPGDELLKGAAPKIVREGEGDFEPTVKRFDALE